MGLKKAGVFNCESRLVLSAEEGSLAFEAYEGGGKRRLSKI